MYSRGLYKRARTLALVTVAGIGCTGILVAPAATGLAGPGAAQSSQPSGKSAQTQAIGKVRAAVTAARKHRAIPSYRPRLSTLGQDVAGVGTCDYATATRKLCKRGDRDSKRSIVVFGDSHARHWIPAVNKAALRNGYAAYYLVKPGCNPSYMQRSTSSGAVACDNFRQWASDQIHALEPDLVVLAGDVPDVTLDEHGDSVRDPATLTRIYQAGLIKRIDLLRDAAGSIVVIGDTPGLLVPPKECLRARGNDLRDCSFKPSSRAHLEFAAARRAAAKTQARFLNPWPWFCYHGLCPSVVGNVITYRDLGHVTPQYSGTLAAAMAQALQLTTP